MDSYLDIVVEKVGTKENPAVVLAKHVERSVLDRHMEFVNIWREHGRRDIAPHIEK